MKIRKEKVIWLFKQLFPLTYYTTYSEKDPDNKLTYKHFVIWRQWFGKTLSKCDVVISGGKI